VQIPTQALTGISNDGIQQMMNYKVWCIVKHSVVPLGRKYVKCKWVFDIKWNGVFQARLVACGYSQAPGVDFQESYSPVINDVIFRLLLVLQLALCLKSVIIDIETAFLNRELTEEIYMSTLEGLKAQEDECVLLEKAIYGLVQALECFISSSKQSWSSLNLNQVKVNRACSLRRPMALWSLLWFMLMTVMWWKWCELESLYQRYSDGISDQDPRESNWLSFLQYTSWYRKRVWMAWTATLDQTIGKSFGNLINQTNIWYTTPGTPNQIIVCPETEEDQLDPERQMKHGSAVGTLLQFVKHSCPDIANPVRELSKCMDKATEAAYKEMLRIVKFVLDTRNFGLFLRPTAIDSDGSWSITVYSDLNWIGLEI
jgi:Reverse transcriptase (RNA-dependent DNA polymerase)